MTLPDDFFRSRFQGNLSTGSDLARPKAGGGLTLSKTIQPNRNWSVTLSYDIFPNPLPGACRQATGACLAASAWKPSHNAEITFTQDGWHGKSTLGVASEGSTADGHYGVKADIQRGPTQANTEDQADLQRELFRNPLRSLPRRELGGFSAQPADLSSDVSTISGAGAIAFAGEHVAVGRPIGDSFAIVVPHDPADTTTLRVPGEASPRARSDSLGPALAAGASHRRPEFAVSDRGRGILPQGTVGSGIFRCASRATGAAMF